MNNKKAKLLRKLTRAAAPAGIKESVIKGAYRSIKKKYNAVPSDKRNAYAKSLASDSKVSAAMNKIHEEAQKAS